MSFYFGALGDGWFLLQFPYPYQQAYFYFIMIWVFHCGRGCWVLACVWWDPCRWCGSFFIWDREGFIFFIPWGWICWHRFEVNRAGEVGNMKWCFSSLFWKQLDPIRSQSSCPSIQHGINKISLISFNYKGLIKFMTPLHQQKNYIPPIPQFPSFLGS